MFSPAKYTLAPSFQIKGTIGIQGLRVRCIIGVLEQERHHEQEVKIDLKVERDFQPCAHADALNETLDYVTLAEMCQQLGQERRYGLIETFAWEVLHKLLELRGVSYAWVRIAKPGAVPQAESAFVECEGTRRQ